MDTVAILAQGTKSWLATRSPVLSFSHVSVVVIYSIVTTFQFLEVFPLGLSGELTRRPMPKAVTYERGLEWPAKKHTSRNRLLQNRELREHARF